MMEGIIDCIAFLLTCLGITGIACGIFLPAAIYGAWLALDSLRNTVLDIMDNIATAYHEARIRN